LQKIKVAPGRWGMGLFIAETAVVDDLIIGSFARTCSFG